MGYLQSLWMILSGQWFYVPGRRRIHTDFDKLGKCSKIKEMKKKQRQVKAQHLGSLMLKHISKNNCLRKSIAATE